MQEIGLDGSMSRGRGNYRDQQFGAQHLLWRGQSNINAVPLESRIELPLHPILAQVVNPPPPSHPRHQGKMAEQQQLLLIHHRRKTKSIP